MKKSSLPTKYRLHVVTEHLYQLKKGLSLYQFAKGLNV